jgi:hypothetical protein
MSHPPSNRASIWLNRQEADQQLTSMIAGLSISRHSAMDALIAASMFAWPCW